MTYFRIYTSDIAYKTKQPMGLFVAVWKLVEKSFSLQKKKKNTGKTRGNPEKAVTWFKDTVDGKQIYSEMTFYRDIAKKYGLVLFISECDEAPGDIIYEDAFQIAVINPKSAINTRKLTEYKEGQLL